MTWSARALVLAIALAGVAASATAQEGGIAASGMGQGEASINVRSDVKLAIKGTRGTSTENLEKLTEAIADQMPNLRACYRKLIETRPTAAGAIAARITLDPGKAPAQLEIKEVGEPEPDLNTCVRKVFEKAPLSKVPRPAAAIATLELSNSRAAGQAAMLEHKATAGKVEVRSESGGYVADWMTTDKEVAFTVRGSGSEAVEAVVRGLRDRFAGFLDCRRRAKKGDLSPGGTIQAALRLARGGEASSKVGASTVAHERAPICVERALSRVTFEGAPAGQKVDVTVTFAP
jgi:hypothetical protein